MFSEIKKKCFSNQKQIQPVEVHVKELIEPVEVLIPVKEPVKVLIHVQAQKNNKLITCYEEDYTRNTNEIMKLWQRN